MFKNWFRRPEAVKPVDPLPVIVVPQGPIDPEPMIQPVVKAPKPVKRRAKPPVRAARKKRSIEARNKDIADRYVAGDISKGKLARVYGLTHPRIIQILREQGVYKPGRVHEKKERPAPSHNAMTLPHPLRREAAALFDSGMPQAEIAKQMGVSIATISRSTRRYAKTIGTKHWTDEDVDNLSTLWPDSSIPIKDIADLIGVSEVAARAKARRLNLIRPT